MYTCCLLWEIVHPSVFAQELNRIMAWWLAAEEIPFVFFPGKSRKKNLGDFPAAARP